MFVNRIAALSMIIGVLLWLLFGLVLIVGVVGSDVCTEFDVFQVRQ